MWFPGELCDLRSAYFGNSRYQWLACIGGVEAHPVAAEIIGVHHIDDAGFATWNANTVNSASGESGGIQQANARRRNVLVSRVELCVVEGLEIIFLCKFASNRIDAEVYNGWAESGDGNFAACGLPIETVVDPNAIPITVNYQDFVTGMGRDYLPRGKNDAVVG
jgi:hypothetical protein